MVPSADARAPALRRSRGDVEAEAAVAVLQADPARAAGLAVLDAAVRTAKGLSASLAERIFRDPDLRRSYRRHAWRERHAAGG